MSALVPGHCILLHCRIDAYFGAWSNNVELQPVITKVIKQELIAVFIQALHRNEYDLSLRAIPVLLTLFADISNVVRFLSQHLLTNNNFHIYFAVHN